MSEVVVYSGWEGGWDEDFDSPLDNPSAEVTDVTIADGVTEIKELAFYDCKGLINLGFLKGSAITTIGEYAFDSSGVTTLLGIELVRKIGTCAFFQCKDLRTIEGLGCEEMGPWCFVGCTSLQSMKWWPASMTVIPDRCFWGCTGMTTVDCDLSHVTSIGVNAFVGCTSLLPPSLSKEGADPAAVLAFLKRKSFLERAPERRTFLCSLKSAHSDFYNRTGDPCGASRRIIMEFAGLFPA
jgi:hypothetical protein